MIHPATRLLERLLSADPTTNELAEAEAHVNGCDVCLGKLESLQRVRSDDFRLLVELLANPPASLSTHAAGESLQLCTDCAAPTSETLLPTFEGYAVLSRVGGGGMGEVYQARHLRTNRLVALKTVSAAYQPGSAEHQMFLARFSLEGITATRVHHPHVVTVYDVGQQDGRPYLSMEWVAGGNLAEALNNRPQAPRLAAGCVATLARAVEHVHRAGIIHCDLKPANILLQTLDGQKAPPPGTCTLKIADFGIARSLGMPRSSATRQWLGTPEYVAPELTGEHNRAGVVSPAADIYGLGVILYEMLTGRPPFRADEPLETLRQVRDEEPASPRRLQPGVPRDLEIICLRCLQKDPRKRYASAGALADDLDRWLTGRPILARPLGRAARLAKWGQRYPERAVIAAIGLALVFAGLAASFGQCWSSNAEHARQLASSADHQFLLIKYAAGQTARAGDLRDLLASAQPDARNLQLLLEKTKHEFLRWFTRPGEAPPIVNWFVMSPDGLILADSYEDPRSVGKLYNYRDYYQGIRDLDPTHDRWEVYLSRVYQSEQDGRFKVTATTRVWDGDRVLGFVGASLAVDSRMVALDMKQEAAGAALAGPADRNRRPGDSAEAAPEFVVILHRDYAVPGQRPISITGSEADRMRSFAANPALIAAADFFGPQGGFVHYARVGDSHFVAMVERAYPGPLGFLLQWPLGTCLALPGAGLAGLIVLRRFRARGLLA